MSPVRAGSREQKADPSPFFSSEKNQTFAAGTIGIPLILYHTVTLES